MPKSAPSTLYMLHFIAHRLNFTITWNVAQRTADGLYSNLWISDAFHELIRSVGCFPTGLAEHKAWKIESRDCFCSHFSWAPECHPYHHRKKKNIRRARDLLCQATQLLWTMQQPSRDLQETERPKNIAKDMLFWHPPPHLQIVQNLGQTACVNVHSCLNLSSLQARYFNSIKEGE